MNVSNEPVEARPFGQPQIAPRDGSRSALIWGFVLIVIGGGALAGQLWPDFSRYVPLVIGLGLLGVFAINRSYIALVGGAIMTGIGVGLIASDLFPNADADGPGVTIGLGLGFVSIWVISTVMRLKEHHFWPLIPGGILLLVGIGLTLDLFSRDISKYAIPAIVVAIGALIMLVGYLRMPRGTGTAE